MRKNDKIREMIDNAKGSIFECKGTNDPEVITYDGIISNADNSPEILFLLKEPNDGRDSSRDKKLDFSHGFDFPKTAAEEAQNQNERKPEHWDNLCYWTKAFKNAQTGEPQLFLNNSVQKCGEYLGEIAIVNIKKVPGGSNVKDYDAILATSNNPVCTKLRGHCI